MHIRMRHFVLSLVAAMIAGGAASGGLLLYGQMPIAGLGAHAAPAAGADLAKLEQVYSTLRNDFYQPVDRTKAVDGAIDGMLKALDDPYSTYMSAAETKSFMEHVSSSFEGIGAEIREENGEIMVVSPLHGAPAEKAGLKPYDAILDVNGTKLSGMKVTEAVKYIRGPKGSEAKLTIRRPGADRPFEVVIVRDTIPQETVFARMLDDRTGVIRVTKFSERTAEEFSKALADLTSKGARGIVLDLRRNPGGLLSTAVKMAEEFVPKDQLILQVKDRDGNVQQHRSKGHKSDLPWVVVIDKGSASASEILAGAMQESAGIALVGETSFGKGTVQTTEEYPDGSSIKYTIAQWLTPKGNQINKAGIKPDVEVKLPEYANLPYPVVEREYKQGEQATPVQIVQTMLKVLGHDPGREDGLLDEGTARAIKAFQAARKLEQTGTLNEETTLQAALAIQQKIQENDTQLAKAREMLQGLIK